MKDINGLVGPAFNYMLILAEKETGCPKHNKTFHVHKQTAHGLNRGCLL
jgi:hypothetical protein